jgi:hypothetical protein
MTYQKPLHTKPASTTEQSGLEMVAGMLHRPSTEKLSVKKLEQRITASLHNEDQASKTKECCKTKSL